MEKFNFAGTGTGATFSYVGTGSEAVTWKPVSNASDASTVTIAGTETKTITVNGTIDIRTVAGLSLIAPEGADTYTLGGTSGVGSLASVVGGVTSTVRVATFQNVPELDIDLGSQDTAGQADRLNVTSLTGTGLAKISLTTGDGNDTLDLSAIGSVALRSPRVLASSSMAVPVRRIASSLAARAR